MTLRLVLVTGNINWFGLCTDDYVNCAWVVPIEDQGYYPAAIRVFSEDIRPAMMTFVGIVGVGDHRLYHYPLHPWSQ